MPYLGIEKPYHIMANKINVMQSQQEVSDLQHNCWGVDELMMYVGS